MEINATKLGIATSIVLAVTWAVCSLLILSMPFGMMPVRNGMFHAGYGQMPMMLNWGGFISGLFAWAIVGGIIAWAIATVYNRLIR